jgi:hypothetical protein
MDLDEEGFEPLGEAEQAMLDDLRKIAGPQGCHWIDDAGQFCDIPRAKMPSRYPYCEEHLRRSLTEAGWRRMLLSVGRDPDN